MAAKTPAKKASKAVKKIVKPVASKAVAGKSAPKPAAKAAKAPSHKPSQPTAAAVGKVAVKKSASVSKTVGGVNKQPIANSATAKTSAKSAPVAPAKPTSKPGVKPASVKAPSAAASASTPAKKVATVRPATGSLAKPAPPSSKNPVPVSKSSAKTPSKTQSPVKPAATRPIGKVAVAVTSRPPTPAPRNKYKVVEYAIDENTGRPILPAGYKPSAEEEYMSTLQQEYFRQRLQHWRADLVEESKQTIENLREEVRDIGDEAERATRETENSLELRTRDRYRKLIGKIDSTLKRLDAGDYGYCVDTGEEIGLERLDARLTAERTIDAQERWEHLQKQQGD